jgi:hypothetical protein
MDEIGEIEIRSSASDWQEEESKIAKGGLLSLPLLVDLAERQKEIKAIRFELRQRHNWFILGLAFAAFLLALLCLY